MQPSPTPLENEKDLKTEEFTLDLDSKESYYMKISYGQKIIIFLIKGLKNFPVQFYELNTNLNDIQKIDENFLLFNSPQKLISAIKKCITNKKYKISSNDEKLKLSIENDFFENNIASIEIPLKEQEINTKVNALTQVILDLKEELKKTKEELKNTKEKLDMTTNELKTINEDFEKTKNELNAINILKKEKEEKILVKKNNKIKYAKESFEGSEILNDEDKILISEWIDDKKVFKFNMLYSTKKDGESASNFHYNCDGVSPTVVIIKDTNGNKFGGYTTSSWAQSPVGGSYARDKNAFTFSLNKKKKVLQVDKFSKYSIYRNNSYGPTFGSHYLYICNGCTGNQSSFANYNNGYESNNLFGASTTTYFQVSCYEVYHVITI